MSDLFDDSSSEFMTLDQYRADLRERRLVRGEGVDSWKLERIQYFSDPTDQPWAAFAEGRWEESIALMEKARPLFDKYCKEAATHGVTLHRVRVVEEPIRPYVQWEFHYLRLATSVGEKIRVVTAEQVSQFEGEEQLPDILTAGTDSVYRILYADEGVPEAARRIIDRETAERCAGFIRDLYGKAEDMDEYFERRIARLGPPTLERR